MITLASAAQEPEDASERSKKGGRGKKATTSGGVSAAPQQRIADARAVLAYSPELADAVMRQGKPLQTALAEARLSQGSVHNDRSEVGVKGTGCTSMIMVGLILLR